MIGLFHNVLTELVFFQKVAQLKKRMHLSTFNSISPLLNFLLKVLILLFTVRILILFAMTNSNSTVHLLQN